MRKESKSTDNMKDKLNNSKDEESKDKISNKNEDKSISWENKEKKAIFDQSGDEILDDKELKRDNYATREQADRNNYNSMIDAQQLKNNLDLQEDKQISNISINEPLTLSKVVSKETRPFYLTWQDVDLKITKKKVIGFCKYKKEDKHILKSISGYARSGECLAIMGASGSGKSTLLNILSGRLVNKGKFKLNGAVEVNKEKMEWLKFRNVTGFVMQRDTFFEDSKVKENFDFFINLRSSNINEQQRAQKLKEIIGFLKLTKVKDNFIGGKLQKGISGGEKRRLNLGVELVSDPKILLLDEPTSGLDSYTALIIIKRLKELAKLNNMIIIYTIHQPSNKIFNLFDNLLILNRGKIDYFGQADAVERFYSDIGYAPPQLKQPIDFFIELTIKAEERYEETVKRVYQEQTIHQINEVIENTPDNEINKKIRKAGFCQQFYQLTKRGTRRFFRNKISFHMRLVQVIFLIIIYSMLYFQLDEIDPNNPNSISNRLGAFFFLVLNIFIVFFTTSVSICKLSSS